MSQEQPRPKGANRSGPHHEACASRGASYHIDAFLNVVQTRSLSGGGQHYFFASRPESRHDDLRQRRADEPDPARHHTSCNLHHRLRRHRPIRPHIHQHKIRDRPSSEQQHSRTGEHDDHGIEHSIVLLRPTTRSHCRSGPTSPPAQQRERADQFSSPPKTRPRFNSVSLRVCKPRLSNREVRR
jgi:hypothetical protein